MSLINTVTETNYTDYIPWKRTSMFKTDRDTGVLYLASIKGEGIFKISGIGAFIWKHIDGQTSVGELNRLVMQAYEGCSQKQVSADIRRILDQMAEKDLIIYNWDALL